MKSHLKRLTTKPSASLREGIAALNSGLEIAFVCEGRGRIVGTLTDGDVRRAILREEDLDATDGVARAMKREFKRATPDTPRAAVLDLMKAFRIGQIPIVDAKGVLIGVHTLHEMLGGPRERPNWAVIMAGGKGTRLRPLTENIPKPMLPVAGRPILERLVLHLVSHGVKTIYLAVNYLAEQIEEHFEDGSNFGCTIDYIREDEPRGTGGALSLLPKRPKHPLLVMNGDLITEADIGRILDFHERGDFRATTCLSPYQVKVPFGVATVKKNRLVAMHEKPTQEMLINAGIYVVSPPALRLVPKKGMFPIVGIFDKCLEKNLPVGAHVLDADWADVGLPDELKKARGQV